jgi:hypothetical protein
MPVVNELRETGTCGCGSLPFGWTEGTHDEELGRNNEQALSCNKVCWIASEEKSAGAEVKCAVAGTTHSMHVLHLFF